MQFNIPNLSPDGKITPDLLLELKQHMAEEAFKEAKEARTILAKIDKIKAEYAASLRVLATEHQWQKYQRHHKNRIQKISNLRQQIGKNAGAAEKLTQARHIAIEQSKKFFAREGIDVREISRLRKDRAESMRKMIERLLHL